MDPKTFRKNLIYQMVFSICIVVFLSIAWELSLKEQILSKFPGFSPAWINIVVNTLIIMVVMVFPAVTILKGTLDNMVDIETRLGASTRRYKTIIEATNDLIIQLDTDGIIVYANPAVRLLGYETENLIGKPIGEIVFNENRHEIVPRITTKRVGHRATFNCPVQLSTASDSVLSEQIPAIEFVMDACGLWEQPDDIVQTKGTEKKCIGTLCVARPVVDRALLEEIE